MIINWDMWSEERQVLDRKRFVERTHLHSGARSGPPPSLQVSKLKYLLDFNIYKGLIFHTNPLSIISKRK